MKFLHLHVHRGYFDLVLLSLAVSLIAYIAWASHQSTLLCHIQTPHAWDMRSSFTVPFYSALKCRLRSSWWTLQPIWCHPWGAWRSNKVGDMNGVYGYLCLCMWADARQLLRFWVPFNSKCTYMVYVYIHIFVFHYSIIDMLVLWVTLKLMRMVLPPSILWTGWSSFMAQFLSMGGLLWYVGIVPPSCIITHHISANNGYMQCNRNAYTYALWCKNGNYSMHII